MGSSTSKAPGITNLDLLEWREIGIHRETAKIVQNMQGKGTAELQTIPLDLKRNLQKEIEIYEYRKTSSYPLVKCLGVVESQVKSSSICGSSSALKVLTERIPLRFNQLPQLSFPQTLYSLSQCLRGYKDCYNKLGPFDVTDQMIGVNQQGDLKIWVNQNFGQNHPEIQKPLLQTSGNQIQQGISQPFVKRSAEAQMVTKIVQLIEKKNDFGKYPRDFAQRVYNKNLSFNEAFKEIEAFSKTKNIFVPERLQLAGTKTGNASFVPIDYQTTIDRSSANTAMNPARQLFVDQKDLNPLAQRVFSPIIYNKEGSIGAQKQKSNLISNEKNGVGSPIKILLQQRIGNQQFQSQGSKMLNAPQRSIVSPRSQAVGSKVTFRLVSPGSSMLSFD